jgi:hypothetical protein
MEYRLLYTGVRSTECGEFYVIIAEICINGDYSRENL